MQKLIFGHKNPDTDTVMSSLILTDILKQEGDDVKSCTLGQLNAETKYIINFLKVNQPEIINKVENNQEVILVDHNELAQSVQNIESANIQMIIDHHRIGGFKTKLPIYMRCEPVGCTATILYKMYQEKNLVISKNIAYMIISAIISDTLLLKSPTTTDEDILVIKQLSQQFAIDYKEYGLKMLKAGTNLDHVSELELLTLDTKEFMVGEYKYEIAQINTVDIDEILEKRSENLQAEIQNRIKGQQLYLFIFLITDIINSNSKAIVLGSGTNFFEKQLNCQVKDNLVFLPGVLSRKKQIVPFL